MSAKRIVLIDDEQYLSAVIEMCLEKVGGWSVFAAYSGSAGLLLAQTKQPDAILLDVMMPDISGFEVLQQLKSDPLTQRIPVILLTAKMQAVVEADYARLGIVSVLTKPFDPLTLANQVANTLGW